MRSARSSSKSASGQAISTRWPSASSLRAAASTAARHSGCRLPPRISASRPIRRRPGSAPISLAYGRAGSASTNRSPGSLPCTASSSTAASRTLRVTAKPTNERPIQVGSSAIRPREGLRPTRPHQAAGSRIEPAPSLACAIGTRPAATAAQAPPEEPLGERARSQGLWVGPKASGCVVDCRPNSGILLLPTVTSPARRKRAPR